MKNELYELRKKMESCKECKSAIISLKNYPFKHDFSWVPTKTTILFIGEEPPETGNFIYDLTNKRFTIGFLGLLKKGGLLEEIDLKEFVERGYYLADVVKCPGGEAKNCKKFLKEEIEILNPKVIVALGKKALSVFLNVKSFKLSEYVGKFLTENDLNNFLIMNKPIFSMYFPMKVPIKDDIKIKHLKSLLVYKKQIPNKCYQQRLW